MWYILILKGILFHQLLYMAYYYYLCERICQFNWKQKVNNLQMCILRQIQSTGTKIAQLVTENLTRLLYQNLLLALHCIEISTIILQIYYLKKQHMKILSLQVVPRIVNQRSTIAVTFCENYKFCAQIKQNRTNRVKLDCIGDLQVYPFLDFNFVVCISYGFICIFIILFLAMWKTQVFIRVVLKQIVCMYKFYK
eukprot:TRINITY_DN11571_c0_g3_i2.p1 TRINITY_DN11571_c0_g3~~TRINITY_DN11571_c0_g3_i2.p1  ORF type:complete len:195 (+),score=-8.61 TRINITY_DN11571_c0_g3_i2:674-1258(+)